MAKDAKAAVEGAEAAPKKSKKLLIIILAVVLLVVLGGVALTAFAYLGPILFPDRFAPPLRDVTLPVTLEAE